MSIRNVWMKKHLCIIVGLLICLGMFGCSFQKSYADAGQPEKETIMEEQVDQGQGLSFLETYKNPVVHRSRETGVPGLKVIDVFDKAHLVKDPLIPKAWLELKTGEKLKHNVGNIGLALKKLKFVPKTEAEALLVARVYFLDNNSSQHAILLDPGVPFPGFLGANEKVLTDELGLEKPAAVRDGSNFKVTMFVATNPKHERIFNRVVKTFISKYEFFIGPEVYAIVDSADLWPEEQKQFSNQTPVRQKRPLIDAPTEAPKRSFKQSYPNPVILKPRETVVPGLKIIYVYDQSWIVEDPLVPQAWLDLATGEKLEHTQDGIQTALQKLKFVPKNEFEAIEVARIYIEDSYNNQNTILMENGVPFPTAATAAQYPGVENLGLSKPTAVPDGKNFKVTLFVFTDPKNERRLNKNAKPSFSRYEFLIGPGVYRIMGSEVIWPEDMKLQVKLKPTTVSTPFQLTAKTKLPPPQGPEPVLVAVLKNISAAPMKVVADSWVQPVRLILTDSSGKEMPAEDQRAIASRMVGSNEKLIETLVPGQELFPARLDHRKTERRYEATWGTYKFRNLSPGIYRAKLVWESQMSSYLSKSGQAVPIDGIWLGRVESEPIELVFP